MVQEFYKRNIKKKDCYISTLDEIGLLKLNNTEGYQKLPNEF